MDIVPPGAKFLSNLGTHETRKQVCPSKTQWWDRTGLVWIVPVQKGERGRGKSGSRVPSKSETQCTSLSNGLGLLIQFCYFYICLKFSKIKKNIKGKIASFLPTIKKCRLIAGKKYKQTNNLQPRSNPLFTSGTFLHIHQTCFAYFSLFCIISALYI